MNSVSKLIITTAVSVAALLAQPSPPDPTTMVQHRVTQLTAQLTLSSSQATQATAIYTNAATAVAPLQAEMKTYRATLQAAVKSGASETIDQTAASIGTTMGQILAIQSKADAAFYLTLSTSQQAAMSATPGALGSLGPGGPGAGGPPPGPPPDRGGQ